MKLACSTWMLPGETFDDKIRAAAEYGFEGVDVRLFMNVATPEFIKEIADALRRYGVKASSLLYAGPIFSSTLDSEKVLDGKIEHAKRAFEIAAEFECPALICPEHYYQDPLPLFDHPKRPSAAERELLMRYLSFAADLAEKNGIKALLEPINRYETRFYYSVEDGMEYIKEIGKESLVLLPDFFHMNIEEQDIPNAFRKGGRHIGHIHLGDSNRLLPGQGAIDFKAGFAALKEIGYSGYMCLECSVKGDPSIELPKNVKYMSSLM